MSAAIMSRHAGLSDDEIVARARRVFVDRGYAARTQQIAAAVGLTWGAIALRFGNKDKLFARAMAGPDGPAAPPGGILELPDLLQRLRDYLWQRWPRRLQLRLAPGQFAAGDEAEALVRWLAPAIALQARSGSIRADIDPETLARVLVALCIGDAARGFVAGERAPRADAALIDGARRLLQER